MMDYINVASLTSAFKRIMGRQLCHYFCMPFSEEILNLTVRYCNCNQYSQSKNSNFINTDEIIDGSLKSHFMTTDEIIYNTFNTCVCVLQYGVLYLLLISLVFIFETMTTILVFYTKFLQLLWQQWLLQRIYYRFKLQEKLIQYYLSREIRSPK